MPSTRSGSARSKTTEESIASSDWSVNTPHDSTSSTETNASIASRSTLTRRSPPPGAHGRQTLPRATTAMESLPAAPAPASAPAAPAPAAPAHAAAAHAASTHASPAPATPALAAPSARAVRSREAGKRRTTRQESSHPAPQNQDKRIALIMQRRNIPPSTDDSSLPLPTRQARDVDVGSTRSSHRKRAEVQARRELALRQLEVAEAKSRLAQADLELLIMEDSDGEDGLEEEVLERSVERWFVQTDEQPKEESEPVKKEDKDPIQELTQALLKLSEKPRDAVSPKHFELSCFDGSSEEWLAFKRSYEDTATSFSDAHNLARLRRAIQGKAQEAVHSLLFTADDPRKVIESLEARFGRPGTIALMELEKLKSLAKVSENPGDVCVFANRVRNAMETIKALRKPQYLCSPETMKVVVEKMPPVLKYRWFAYHESRKDEGIQELVLVKDFLEKEAKMCGDYAPPEVVSEPRKVIRKPIHSVQELPRERFKKSCPFCDEEHFPVECSKFKEAELEEKWNMLKKSRICFKCLRFKHSRVNCRAPVCKKCGRWHHTILHSDKSSVPPEKELGREEKVASVHDARGEERAYLKIMPVDLFGPKGQVRVLALLDEGSTVTLLDSSIAEEIGAKGVRTTLTIETVGGKVMKKEGSQKINLKIKGAHGRIKRSITARTIDDLRLSEQAISKKTIRNCRHLKKIQDQLLYATERPKLLIGQDNWGLIVTRRLKKGKPSEPVASLTGLGWVLHGCESGANSVVNFTHYSRSANDKEDIEEVVRDYFQLESLGIQNQLPTNDSDRRALEILESTTRKLPTGEYETGLLWKTEGEALPNNYNQAFRHLLGIEKKLDRNEELKTCYEKHMQNLVEKGYAEKAPTTSPKGRTFLRRPEEEWPVGGFKPEADMPEERINTRVLMTTTTDKSLIDPGRFSSWERLLRVTARVIAFAHKLLRKVRKAVNVVARPKDEAWRPQKKARKKSQVPSRPVDKEKREHPYVPLEEEHLRKAEEMLVTTSQKESFPADAKLLAEGKPLENSSRLKKIDVYVGDDGLIKLRSRTMKFHDDTGRKMNPIVLHGKQRITRLIVEHYHKKFLHANTATVMNEIRQKYWILGLRATIKAIARNCQWCRMRKSAPVVPPTGDLPDERLKHHQFPFSHAAVDFFGPIQVAVGRRVEKRWGALFTCLTTRAVHLELVPSLSTSSMIMALRRLAARRGTPKVIFSDNGTNFVGANRELQEAAQEKGIKWKFIPPGCPNMGGAWERLVRSVKTALTAVLNERNPPEEVLQTLLVEVEHIVNSRPLTPVSTDPTDEESLTPNHFLLGRSCGAMAPGEFNDKDLIGKANWRTSQRLADHFWQRWVKEYLPLLMPRRVQGKGTNDPKEGDIVLIADHTLPRNSWPRGEVVKTYPGPDGKVRVLDVRTSGGILRRATRRVVVLVPASSSHPEEAVLRTVGENVSDE